jgi:hypothetical protein
VDVTPDRGETGFVPAPGDETARLRELHDAYVWEVNAAIGEGREDIVWRLVDQYLDAAMREMTAGLGTGCDRPDCAMCARPRPTVTRRRWWRRLV